MQRFVIEVDDEIVAGLVGDLLLALAAAGGPKPIAAPPGASGRSGCCALTRSHGRLLRRMLAALGADQAAKERVTRDQLTAREAEVMAMAASGRTNTQIAEALFVEQVTVKKCLGRVYRKLGAGGRRDLSACVAALQDRRIAD